MKIIMLCLTLLVGAASVGCSPAMREREFGFAYQKNYTIQVYSGGKLIKTYKSIGKVISEPGSDGYYFTDASTHKLAEVAGDLIIEEQ